MLASTLFNSKGNGISPPENNFKNFITDCCNLALAGQFIMNIFNMKHIGINTFLLKRKWF